MTSSVHNADFNPNICLPRCWFYHLQSTLYLFVEHCSVKENLQSEREFYFPDLVWLYLPIEFFIVKQALWTFTECMFHFFLKLFLVELILYQLFLNSGNINIFLSKGKISECIWIAYEKVAQKFNYVISSNKKVVGTVLTLSTSHISGKGYLS